MSQEKRRGAGRPKISRPLRYVQVDACEGAGVMQESERWIRKARRGAGLIYLLEDGGGVTGGGVNSFCWD